MGLSAVYYKVSPKWRGSTECQRWFPSRWCLSWTVLFWCKQSSCFSAGLMRWEVFFKNSQSRQSSGHLDLVGGLEHLFFFTIRHNHPTWLIFFRGEGIQSVIQIFIFTDEWRSISCFASARCRGQGTPGTPRLFWVTFFTNPQRSPHWVTSIFFSGDFSFLLQSFQHDPRSSSCPIERDSFSRGDDLNI